MKKFIVDTSVTAKLFLEGEDHRDLAIEVFRKADQNEIELYAPSLTLYELNNALVKESDLTEEVLAALEILQRQVKKKIIKIVQPSLTILKKAAEIAMIDTKGQGNISAYDATFHALALLKKATFITSDEKHYNKTKDLIGSVILLEDFN